MPLTPENAMFGHVSTDTAWLVPDYPYGRRVRTEIRYWVETSPRHGDRFVSQTRNPSTGRWNKPKPSTYMPVMVMYLDENGHVTYAGLRQWAADDAIEAFLAAAGDHLSEAQRTAVARVVGLKRAFDHVTFTIVDTATWTDEDRAQQADIERRLNQAVAVESAQAYQDLS